MQQPTHLFLKITVVASIMAIAVMAWLSFWLFSEDVLTLTTFVSQIWQADSPVFWQWSRILAILSYVTLWLSVMTGLSISSQSSSFWFARGTALSWHQFFTWTGLSLALGHAGVLLKDSYLHPSLAQLLIPFTLNHAQLSAFAWVWIGMGQLAFYGMALIAIGALLKQKIAKSLWRYLHAFALLAYVGIVAHGLLIGTDSKQFWLQGLYVGTNLTLVLVVMFRVMQLKFPTASIKNA